MININSQCFWVRLTILLLVIYGQNKMLWADTRLKMETVIVWNLTYKNCSTLCEEWESYLNSLLTKVGSFITSVYTRRLAPFYITSHYKIKGNILVQKSHTKSCHLWMDSKSPNDHFSNHFRWIINFWELLRFVDQSMLPTHKKKRHGIFMVLLIHRQAGGFDSYL